MKEQSKPSPKVYLSYVNADKEYVHELRWAYFDIFSADQLSAGGDWVSQLKSELSSCDIFIVLLTPNSVESSWVLQEIGAAWGLKKPIFVVYTDKRLVTRIPVSLNEEQLFDIKDIEHLRFAVLQCYEEEIAAHT